MEMPIKKPIAELERIINDSSFNIKDCSPLDVAKVEKIAVNLRRQADSLMREIRKRDKRI